MGKKIFVLVVILFMLFGVVIIMSISDKEDDFKAEPLVINEESKKYDAMITVYRKDGSILYQTYGNVKEYTDGTEKNIDVYTKSED